MLRHLLVDWHQGHHSYILHGLGYYGQRERQTQIEGKIPSNSQQHLQFGVLYGSYSSVLLALMKRYLTNGECDICGLSNVFCQRSSNAKFPRHKCRQHTSIAFRFWQEWSLPFWSNPCFRSEKVLGEHTLILTYDHAWSSIL